MRKAPRHLSRAIKRARLRIERASAILQCLLIVAGNHPEKPIEVELMVQVAYNLTEKAIDHLERLS